MKKYGMNKFLYKSGGPLKQYYLITIDVIHIQNIFGWQISGILIAKCPKISSEPTISILMHEKHAWWRWKMTRRTTGARGCKF